MLVCITYRVVLHVNHNRPIELSQIDLIHLHLRPSVLPSLLICLLVRSPARVCLCCASDSNESSFHLLFHLGVVSVTSDKTNFRIQVSTITATTATTTLLPANDLASHTFIRHPAKIPFPTHPLRQPPRLTACQHEQARCRRKQEKGS